MEFCGEMVDSIVDTNELKLNSSIKSDTNFKLIFSLKYFKDVLG